MFRTAEVVDYLMCDSGMSVSYDVPDILGGVAKLAASNASTQAVIRDRNGIILELIGKVIASLGHGTNENAYALLGT